MTGAAAASPRPERAEPAVGLEPGERRPCLLGVCDGTGWILGPEDVARPCECRERLVRRARSRGVASVIPAKYRGVSFDRPPVTQINEIVVRQVRDFCADIEASLADGRGLWLIGDVGTGKTTLAMLVSKTALESGSSVAIYSLPRLLARIRRTYDHGPGEQDYTDFFERLTSADLLHLDDLGAEKRTDWVIEQLYSIVNERYESQRSVLVTLNVEREDHSSKDGPLFGAVERLKAQIGERTVSRLFEMCGDPLPMFDQDRRFAVSPGDVGWAIGGSETPAGPLDH
jgi:DNA replication protein DnaC